ncbi:MAG: hypothetical protein RIS47_1752, partial [Bacteroidota bacterium]
MNIRLLAFLVIISTHVLSSAQVKISGSIIGVESYQTVSIVSLDTNKKIATCPINSSGEFRFEFSVGSTGFYKLEFENEYTIALIISPNDLITLKLYADDTSKPTITGSPETARLYQANIQVSEFNEKEEDLLSEYDQNRQARRSYILEQIRKDPSSLVNFYFFDYLDPNEDRLVIESMVKRMYARYPKNPMVKDLWTKMKLPRAKDNQVLP